MRFSNPKEVVRHMALGHGARVADFGAGSGHYTFAAAHAVGASGKVYAIEILPDLVKRIAAHARLERLENVEVLTGDLETPNGSSLQNGSIDTVIITNVLFQVEERGRILEEAYRVLRDSGGLILVDWTDSFSGMGPLKEQVIPKEAAKKLAEARGFTFQKAVDAGSHHWGMVLRKQK